LNWAPDYTDIFRQRINRVKKINNDPIAQLALKTFYKDNPIAFIEDWGTTYDPRNATKGPELPTLMPLSLFPKQKEFINWLMEKLHKQESGLVEKSRDMGATVIGTAFSVWLWLFIDGSSVGWGSRKELLVDRIGDPDTIFEKIRAFIRYLPSFLLPIGLNPKDHLTFMKCINPENNSTITGEGGDNIGRGGRKLIYFKDESAHYQHAELIEAALGDNTNIQIDISSVNGTGNLFYRKRFSGAVDVFIMDWSDHPLKTQEWYDKRRKNAEDQGLMHLFSQEVDRDYASSMVGICIPAKWVKACVGLKLDIEGEQRGGLDVADEEGQDSNALALVHGTTVQNVEEWNGVDTTVTANMAETRVLHFGGEHILYDSIGVGAGVRAKGNTSAMKFTPVNVGSKNMPGKYADTDRLNKDMFANLKAKLWWEFRERCHRTYKYVTGVEDYDHSELVSLPRDNKLITELSQPLVEYDDAGRIQIESKKKMAKRGIKSPNKADAVMIAFF